jgi:hypothetical protein
MKKKFILTLLLTLSLSFTGCGRNTEEIVVFQNKLNTVVLKMENLDNELNAIDPTSSDAVENALDTLAELNTTFKELADIQVTDEKHLYITDLADEGADYMAHAYELFKKAYTQDSFDEDNAALAYQYLERATKRVRVIVTMLHDKIPEGVIIQ